MLEQMKKRHSDVIVEKVSAINATVTVPDDAEELAIGTLLSSKDGGLTFAPAAEDEDLALWNPNGVLCDYIKKTETVSVLTMGAVVERNLLGFTEDLRVKLFENKINLK